MFNNDVIHRNVNLFSSINKNKHSLNRKTASNKKISYIETINEKTELEDAGSDEDYSKMLKYNRDAKTVRKTEE